MDVANQNTIAVELAAELVAAWLGNANTRATAEEVPAFLRAMHKTVVELSGGADAGDNQAVPGDAPSMNQQQHVPAVSVRKSLASPDHIISMLDGKLYRTLKRHLARHGLTPDQYRARYGLNADYPMTEPAYAAQRSEMAKKLGLGRKMGQKAPQKRKAAARQVKGSKADNGPGNAS